MWLAKTTSGRNYMKNQGPYTENPWKNRQVSKRAKISIAVKPFALLHIPHHSTVPASILDDLERCPCVHLFSYTYELQQPSAIGSLACDLPQHCVYVPQQSLLAFCSASPETLTSAKGRLWTEYLHLHSRTTHSVLFPDSWETWMTPLGSCTHYIRGQLGRPSPTRRLALQELSNLVHKILHPPFHQRASSTTLAWRVDPTTARSWASGWMPSSSPFGRSLSWIASGTICCQSSWVNDKNIHLLVPPLVSRLLDKWRPNVDNRKWRWRWIPVPERRQFSDHPTWRVQQSCEFLSEI